MSSGDPSGVSSQRLMTLRIIHLALLMGCGTFGVCVYVMRQQGLRAAPPDPPILGYVGAGLAALMAVLFIVLPPAIVAAWRRRMATEQAAKTVRPEDFETGCWNMFQFKFIFGAVQLEVAIFMN